MILRPGPYATGIALQDSRSQASLLRARTHGGTFTAGGLLSVRDCGGGRSNQVAGVDGVWRASDEEQLRLRGLLSSTTALCDGNGAAVRGGREAGHHLFASWWKRVPGWNFTAEASEVSPRFRNDNGFVDQAGVRSVQTEVIRRFGETALPGFTAYEFEAFVWAQHRSAVADSRDGAEGGQTVSRRLHPGIWLVASRNTEAWAQVRFDAERAGSGRRLHALRSVAGSYGVNPAAWFTRLVTELEVGERLDVAADRIGRGAVWLVDAKLRTSTPGGWGLESEQRIAQGFIDGPDGRRALTDTAVQWLGVLHFSPRDALRVVWQGTRYQRTADASADLAAFNGRSQTTSLVFQHRFGIGRSLSLGASRQTARPGMQRDSEAFAKLSFELDR